MTDKVEEKIVSMLDALQSGVVHVGEQVVKYSPDVADAALWVVRIEGVSALIYGVIGLFAIAIAIILFRKYLWHNSQYTAEFKLYCSKQGVEERIHRNNANNHYFWRLAFGFSALGFTFVGFGFLKKLLDIWNWVAVFEPKLYIAKQIIDAALK